MAYTIAVRALCEFTARSGDLDLRFTPAPTAEEGIAGHLLVQGRRAPPYEAELTLSATIGELTVRGRADGFDPRRPRLEEIKTHKGDLALQPAHHRTLHWAQAKVYAALLCRARGLAALEVALVYLDVGSQQETVFVEQHTAEALDAFLQDHCARFAQWARQEAAHREARDAALAALRFPHAAFRPGQRALSEAVYRAAMQRRCLLAEAPTGLGKSIGTVFPMLKAMPASGLDKLCFLTAKRSGRGLAWQALAQLCDTPAMPLRAVELVARDHACEHPDKACHGESCPLAKGFHDRLPAARAHAVGLPRLDGPHLREVALHHGICPYYLGQEMVRWADVVVADYNHYLDPYALLHAHVLVQGWRVGLLIDEAHNLVDRARQMYSASLPHAALRRARREAPKPLKRPLDQLNRAWLAQARVAPADYTVLPELPTTWMGALQRACSAVGEHLSAHPTEVLPEVQAFYLAALHFTRLAETLGPHALVDMQTEGDAHRAPDSVISIRNVLPAPHLAPRWAQAHTVTLFSATLQPPAYFLSLLGLPDNTVCMQVPAPFDAAQLTVQVARSVSTRYADRARSLPAIVALMAKTYAARPGNYLAFFSSHAYLQTVADAFEAAHHEVPVWRQQRQMRDADQQAFLARFVPDGQGIGFAVLGGSFSEGVDLPGTRLVGAFIATLGLPQVSPMLEAMQQRLGELVDPSVGSGYECTYLYPGLQRIVQAAGRVIRTPEDTGTVVLMDDRYGRSAVQRLLPDWWPPPVNA